jgi:hypothetical protein
MSNLPVAFSAHHVAPMLPIEQHASPSLCRQRRGSLETAGVPSLICRPQPRPSPTMRSLRRFAASTPRSRRCSLPVSGGRTEPRCHLPLDCASGPPTPIGAVSELTPTTLLRRPRIREAASKGARRPAHPRSEVCPPLREGTGRTVGPQVPPTHGKRTDQLTALRRSCASKARGP